MDKTLICCHFLGGLGNQLFQYSLSKELSLSIPNSEIVFDLSEYNSYKIRDFDLFSTKIIPPASPSPMILRKEPKGFRQKQMLHRILFKLSPTDSLGLKKYPLFLFNQAAKRGDIFYYGREFLEMPRISTSVHRITICGYFQSPLYFPNYEKNIRKDVVPRTPLSKKAVFLLKKIEESHGEAVCLSFRCSETQKMGLFLGDLEPDFFPKINALISSRFSSSVKILFTEDITTARKFINNIDSFYLADSLPPIEQLYLMSKCSVFLIPNSSFAWWGSFLSERENKLIFAPRFWYPHVCTQNLPLFSEKVIYI